MSKDPLLPPSGPLYVCGRCGNKGVTYSATYSAARASTEIIAGKRPMLPQSGSLSNVTWTCPQCGEIDAVDVLETTSTSSLAVAEKRRQEAERSLPASPLAKYKRRVADEKDKKAKVADLIALKKELLGE